jgi:hypothetical protein
LIEQRGCGAKVVDFLGEITTDIHAPCQWPATSPARR